MRRAILMFPAAALLAAVGCGVFQSSTNDATATQDGEIRELERRAIGNAAEYPADPIDDATELELKGSKKKRRELGWKVLAKVIKPVPIADQVHVDAGLAQNTIPLFRTWFGRDEFERMFAKMFADIGPARRKTRDGATAAEMSSLLSWNATTLGPSSEYDYFERISRIDAKVGLDGLGGNARMAYSPAYVRKYFADYGAAVNCEGKLASLPIDAPPPSETNFTNCFSSEFDQNTAVIKTSWRRNDQAFHGIPAHDTSGGAIRKRYTGESDKGGWPKDVPLVEADAKQIYTVKLSRGETYSLAAMHIMTKELRHWVWVTIWWSPTPTRDFGQDRPSEIRTLGGPWSNYKMCVVTQFEEGDKDPRGGFPGSLGDAMAATHGAETWCSNPFIEKGEHNAQTNCIGCHQHAGDSKQLNNILGFESAGRGELRSSFPADYSWAFDTPPGPGDTDRFMKLMSTHVRAYDGESVPE